MRKITLCLFVLLSLFSSCGFRIAAWDQSDEDQLIEVLRYDRLESRYLTTGDYSALQQMNTDYAIETRTLLEDILRLGEVRDPSINARFLSFFQDTVLQAVIMDVQTQYADMDDVNEELSKVFSKLQKWLPELPLPTVYTQIGAFGQSIVVSDKMIGISLDKYLGEDYPYYPRYFKAQQIATMRREYIVPDCLCFYLLSIYGLPEPDKRSQEEKDLHMGRVMWVANKAMGKRFFQNRNVQDVERYMAAHPSATVRQLLQK